MPSKYYNPRLARSAGKAQASQYVSVSGVIDQAFEPLHEDIRIQQERLYKQNQEKEKQRQEVEKNLAGDMKFAQELKGSIPQGQQGLYQTAMTEQFAEYAKAYRAAADNPIEQQKLKSEFQSRLSSHSKPHEERRAWITATAESVTKGGGLSSATSAQDLATYQRIKNFENLPPESTTFHPETGRPVEIIFGEDGKPTGEFFDPIEGAKTINLVDKSGDGVYNDIMNTRFPKLLKDAKTSNLTPQALMHQVDAALEGINDQTALHIGIEHLKIGGANGEYSEYLNAVFNDKDETAIYYDMPNDYTFEEMDAFLKMSDEDKAKNTDVTKITGKHGGVEMVKDRLRYVWAQTAADQEANNEQDEIDALAAEQRKEDNIRGRQSVKRAETTRIKAQEKTNEIDSFMEDFENKKNLFNLSKNKAGVFTGKIDIKNDNFKKGLNEIGFDIDTTIQNNEGETTGYTIRPRGSTSTMRIDVNQNDSAQVFVEKLLTAIGADKETSLEKAYQYVEPNKNFLDKP